jgi:hypothetical protein
MKKLIYCGFIVIFLGSCGQKAVVYEQSTPEEKWQVIRDDFMVSDAPADIERPLPNVLSEQEVLLKAADVAVKEGVLDPDYYAYQNNPALKDAKIETPILLTDGVTGGPGTYILNVVDASGISLATVSVNSTYDTDEASFERWRSIPDPVTGPANHIITKREAAELSQSQFPGSTVSEPIAVTNLRLEDDPHSHSSIFWYFTVTETARSAAGTADEYILDPFIPGYRSIAGGISNRTALNQGGSVYLNGYRMAKLDTPLRLFDKLETARSAGGASFAPSRVATESMSFTPVLLK